MNNKLFGNIPPLFMKIINFVELEITTLPTADLNTGQIHVIHLCLLWKSRTITNSNVYDINESSESEEELLIVWQVY